MAYPAWTYKGHVTFSDTAKAEAVHALVYIDYMSGMKSDFSDLRFADLSGNALPYYFDYYTAGSIARVWVRVPAGQTTINFYYGNSSATSESSGANTFDFFDELYDLDEWSGDTSSWYISGSTLKCSASGKKLYHTMPYSLNGKSIWANIETKAVTSLKFGLVYRASWGEVQFTRAYVSSTRKWSDGSYSSGSSPLWTDSTDKIDRVDIGASLATTKHYFGETSFTQVTGPTTHTAILPANSFGFYAYAPNTYQMVNWVRVQTAATLINYSVVADGYNQETLEHSVAVHVTPSIRRIDHLHIVQPVTVTPDIKPYELPIVVTPSVRTIDRLHIVQGITVVPDVTKTQNALYISNDVYVSPNAHPLDEGVDLSNYPYTSLTVKKSIADAMWQMDVSFEGFKVPPPQRHIIFDTLDVFGNTNRIFSGIIPEPDYALASVNTRTTITAYDYSYFLSRQMVPYDETTIRLCTEYPTWGDWVEHLLEGTGITAYRIAAGPTTSAEFTFSPTTTKMKAIQSIAEYLGYLFHVYWSGDDANAYFIDPANIDDPDNGLDLPDPYTVTIDDGTLIEVTSARPVSEKTYNRIIVRGRDASNNVYLTSVAESQNLIDELELAREYYEESLNYTTQAICDARSAFLLAGLAGEMYTIRAAFKLRHDFRLWQKIRFVGDGFPARVASTGWLRIVNIQHRCQEANEVVTIECTMDQDISLISELADVFDSNTVSETVSIVDSALSNQVEIQAGTITAIDGTTATVVLENGNTIQARLLQ